MSINTILNFPVSCETSQCNFGNIFSKTNKWLKEVQTSASGRLLQIGCEIRVWRKVHTEMKVTALVIYRDNRIVFNKL